MPSIGSAVKELNPTFALDEARVEPIEVLSAGAGSHPTPVVKKHFTWGRNGFDGVAVGTELRAEMIGISKNTDKTPKAANNNSFFAARAAA